MSSNSATAAASSSINSSSSSSSSNLPEAKIEFVLELSQSLSKLANARVDVLLKQAPSEDDLKRGDVLRQRMGQERLDAAEALEKTSPLKSEMSENSAAQLEDFVETIVYIKELEMVGSVELLKQLIEKFPLFKWARFVSQKQLDRIAASDGSLNFLEMFLQLENLETDTVDLLQNAMFNQRNRIPAVLKVLEYESVLRLEKFAEELQQPWQKFFLDICSNAKSIPKEDRTGRMDLIMRMLTHSILKVDPMTETGDGLVFSRAAKEGDVPLMKLLLSDSKIDVNKVSTDTTTALIQAVVANQVEAVKLLLAQPGINVGYVSLEGGALFLSFALHRDAAIVKMLQNFRPNHKEEEEEGEKKKEGGEEMCKKKKTQQVLSSNTAAATAASCLSISSASVSSSSNSNSNSNSASVSSSSSSSSSKKINAILSTLRAISKIDQEHHLLTQKGSPSDDDLKQMGVLRRKMTQVRLDAAKDLRPTSPFTSEIDKNARYEIEDFIEDMVGAGDDVGSLELLKQLIEKVPLFNLGKFVGQKHLDAVAAYDGSLNFLEMFLQLDNLETDTVDLLQNGMFNQSKRIPAVLKILEYDSVLELEKNRQELQDTWQEFFEDICSNAKSIPKEDRTGRMELIMRMLLHKVLKVDPMAESSDGLTVFSRAAKEGDIPLMKLLLKESKIDVNKVSTDTTTALIQAVVANEVEAVKLILSQPGINVGHVSQEGTALFLSRALHRDQQIVQGLENASE